MEFTVRFMGHRNITAKHRTTLEITKDEEITRKADCIIGVRADKAILMDIIHVSNTMRGDRT